MGLSHLDFWGDYRRQLQNFQHVGTFLDTVATIFAVVGAVVCCRQVSWVNTIKTSPWRSPKQSPQWDRPFRVAAQVKCIIICTRYGKVQ